MRKLVSSVVGFALIMTAACSSDGVCDLPLNPTPTPSPTGQDILKYRDQPECEALTRNQCEERGGKFRSFDDDTMGKDSARAQETCRRSGFTQPSGVNSWIRPRNR